MIKKRDFAEIPENSRTAAGHLDFLRPFPASGHIYSHSDFKKL